MDQRITDLITTMLDERGWWQGTNRDPDSCGECLLTILAELLCVTKEISRDEMRDAEVTLAKRAKIMYPDRVKNAQGWNTNVVITFNDHPDTTLEDVKLVVRGEYAHER